MTNDTGMSAELFAKRLSDAAALAYELSRPGKINISVLLTPLGFMIEGTTFLDGEALRRRKVMSFLDVVRSASGNVLSYAVQHVFDDMELARSAHEKPAA